MSIEKVWNLIQKQTLQVYLAASLLKSPGAMGYNMNYFSHKRLIRRDLAVPTMNKVT